FQSPAACTRRLGSSGTLELETTTMNHEHVATIQTIYGAFGRGDVPAILARVADQTRWDFAGGRPEVAWHAPVTGRVNLPRFFEALMSSVEMQKFEPREFMHC